jgi:amino acid transporter
MESHAEPLGAPATTAPARPGPTAKKRVFARDATGLRKEAGPLDIFIYNINNQNIALGVVFLFGVLAAYPGGSFWLSVIGATLLVIPIYMVYSRLSADMPRSGGDYVWVSRIFGSKAGPILGFTLAITLILVGFTAIGAPMAFMTQYGIAPMMRELGDATGWSWCMSFGNWAYGSTGTLVIGTVFLAAFTLVMLGGVGLYMRLQKYAFFAATGGLIVGILVVFFTTRTGFMHDFNSYVSRIGGSANASTIAEEGGAATAGKSFSLHSTFFAMIWTLYMVLYGATSCYIGGEVRQPARTQRIGMFGSLAFTAIGILLLVVGLLHMGGEKFFMGLGGAEIGLEFPLTYNELVYSVLGQSWVWAILIGGSFIFWTYVWMPINFFTVTRLMLALSLDGYLPKSVSKVNRRFGTPHVAIIIGGLFGWLSLFLFVEGTISTITIVFAGITMFVVSGIAAALYPFTLRRVWASSKPTMFAGIPVITIWGVLQVICCCVILWIFWDDPGAGIHLTTKNEWLNVGTPIFALLLAVAVVVGRRLTGTDLGLASAEIPPD